MGPTLIVCTGCGWPTLSDAFTCGRCGAVLPVPPPPAHLLAPEEEPAPSADPWQDDYNPWHQAPPPVPARYSHDHPGSALSPPDVASPSVWPEHAAPHGWPEHEGPAIGPDDWPSEAPAQWDASDHEHGTLGPDLWPTDQSDSDPWTRAPHPSAPAESAAPIDDDADPDPQVALAGMMPSMSVFTEVSSALSAEAESERRWQALQQARAVADKPSHTIRNVAIVGFLLIAIFAGFLVLQRGTGEPVITATTPVDKLPWRDANAPSGKFRVQLPTTSTATQFTLAGLDGELLVAKLPNGEVRAASFAIDQTIGNQTAFLQEILDERAEQLFGAIQTTPTKVRWGLAIDGTMDLGSKAIAIRASMVGSTLYLVEAESTGTSDRLTALFERATATFVPTESN